MASKNRSLFLSFSSPRSLSLPRGDADRRWLSASQEGSCHQKLTRPASQSPVSSLKNCEERNFCCLSHTHFLVFCDGGPSRLQQIIVSSHLWPSFFLSFPFLSFIPDCWNLPWYPGIAYILFIKERIFPKLPKVMNGPSWSFWENNLCVAVF